MIDIYIPCEGLFSVTDRRAGEVPFYTIKDGLFHVHQSYEQPGDTETYVCNHCRGTEFNVGSGNYMTAIRCVSCGWEAVIHDG